MKIRKCVRVATCCLLSFGSAVTAAYFLLVVLQGTVPLVPFTVCMLGSGALVGTVVALGAYLTARKERKRQAQQAREENAVLYWSAPFSQPEHDRVELSAWEDYVIMEWENAEREQISRMLGY